MKNIDIEKIFNTLTIVDRNSPNLDFSIRHKNKDNFKKLKELYISMSETFEEIFQRYGEKVVENWKTFWKFWENKEIVDREIKSIYGIEVDVALTQITIQCRIDPITQKTDTSWLVINQEQMEILEKIFAFEFV